MGLLNAIRRLALREQLPIREIARRTGLSRNTIRKYLKSGAVEPTFATPERPSKLDPFAEKLAGWLKTEAGKGRKQRRTLKQLHADLIVLGFTGSYNRVAAFAREWRAGRHRDEQTAGRGTFVPLVFQPGEAFQFDWSEDYPIIGGERTKLQVAHTKLAHSRAFVLRAYLLQSHEMLFDAHWHGFRVFGGVPARGIYDSEEDQPLIRWINGPTNAHGGGPGRARQAASGQGPVHGDDQPLRVRADLSRNPASGWEKGPVEKGVQDARPRLWQLMPAFPDLDTVAAWLEERCIVLWQETEHGSLPGTIGGRLRRGAGSADAPAARIRRPQ